MTPRRIPLPIVGVVVPAVVALAGVIAGLVVLPPGDVVVHWGVDGAPDGWAPAWTVVVGMAALGVVGTLAFGLPILASRAEGHSSLQRFLAAVAVGFSVLMTTLLLWVLVSQRDPGAETPNVGVGLALGFGLAAVLGVLAWLVAPPAAPVAPTGATADPLPLAAGERAVWIGRTHLATAGIVTISIAILAALGAAIVANVVTEGALGAIFLVPVVLLVVLLLTSFWTVRVDESGLEVRSVVGWPRFRMPAAQVASAGTVEVRAVGEFGGWGIRAGRGRRLGIVMRSGEGLEAQNRDGGALVVTIDDAGTAAALLSAVATRAATADPG